MNGYYICDHCGHDSRPRTGAGQMSELVKRLRALVILDEVRSDNPLGREAADRIEELEAALREKERKVLDPNRCYCRNQFERSHCAYFKDGFCKRTTPEQEK